MTDEQRKRIHDITYSTDDRAELAERIVMLEDERDKLRKENNYLLMNANPTATELRRVRRAWKKDRDENAKLRELAVEVFKCAKRGAACETCKVNNDGYACVYIMRELGIEVG